MAAKKSTICPKCASKSTVPIIYGYPSPELHIKAEQGKAILGGCTVNPDDPERQCKDCGYKWRSGVDEYAMVFCEDCLRVLKEYDEMLYNNLIQSQYPEFYRLDSKGIGVYSITEPILKFIIFSSLCKEYQLWPESPFYKGMKHLDLAMCSCRIEDINADIEPDIAIEMKWGGIKKSGEFNKWSLNFIIDDIIKMHKECEVPNKYIMQFVIIHNDETVIDKETLERQVYESIDKRKVRNREFSLLFSNYFNTKGSDDHIDRRFYILLWKIK